MINYQIESPNLAKLESLLKKYPEISKRHLGKAIVAATVETHKQAIRGVVPWRTGTLTKTMAMESSAGNLIGKVFPTRDYAIYVHEGTAPHIITPNKKRALFWEGALHPVKAVRHPGTQPNRFLPEMLRLAKPDIEKHFEVAIDRILKEIANI